MKPDWKKAPKWANWLAMDKNGVWCWFEWKPKAIDYEEQWVISSGRYKDIPNKDVGWKKSLEARP